MQYNMQTQEINSKSVSKFFIPSLLGLLLFIIPLPYGKFINIEGLSSINIGIGFLAELVKIYGGDNLYTLTFIVVTLSAVLSIGAKIINIKNEFIKNLLDVTPFWLGFRILGAVFTTMIVFEVGPEFIISDVTGQTILSLMPSLIAIFLVSGFLLPLILDFGLMDLFGTLISKTMKTIFNVPGRAAIDTISSWLGDGTLGIMITNAQYKEGFYTKKESAIIATCFSLVSLPFSTVIADQLGLMDMFVPFYATVTLASLVAAIVLPRTYPLAKIANTTYNNVPHQKEEIAEDGSLFTQGLVKAVAKAKEAPSIKTMLINGLKNVVDMYLGLLPLVMAWGTIALVLAEFTPVFTIISYPIIFILELLQIPNAASAAPAVLVGFADMFLPSIMVSGEGFEVITKFIIGALSISQLIFMTETGAVILKSDIPLNLKDLFLVFLMRTAITLPIITLIAHILF